MNSLFYIIYEFFVKYIFGGVLYTDFENFNVYESPIGFMHQDLATDGFFPSSNTYFGFNANQLGLVVHDSTNDALNNNAVLPFGNYLSLISTIITLVIICIFLGLFVRWVFKQFTSILRF